MTNLAIKDIAESLQQIRIVTCTIIAVEFIHIQMCLFSIAHVVFFVVAEYVAKRMRAYRWRMEFDLKKQYRDLLIHWCQLCRRPEVRKEILLPRDENAQRARWSAGIAAAGCKYCEVRKETPLPSDDKDAHQARHK